MPDWNENFLRECGLKPLALSSKLRNVSARTDVVDLVVNQTDSLLESMRDERDGVQLGRKGCGRGFLLITFSSLSSLALTVRLVCKSQGAAFFNYPQAAND
jgi:hypothetical protein